jgi:hypothetical protein
MIAWLKSFVVDDDYDDDSDDDYKPKNVTHNFPSGGIDENEGEDYNRRGNQVNNEG